MDIRTRLTFLIQLVSNRATEHKLISKKYPDFVRDLDQITRGARQQAIDGLMEVFKFQHTIQIIRWMGQAHGRYNYDAWESVSKAIKTRMEKERDLV